MSQHQADISSVSPNRYPSLTVRALCLTLTETLCRKKRRKRDDVATEHSSDMLNAAPPPHIFLTWSECRLKSRSSTLCPWGRSAAWVVNRWSIRRRVAKPERLCSCHRHPSTPRRTARELSSAPGPQAVQEAGPEQAGTPLQRRGCVFPDLGLLQAAVSSGCAAEIWARCCEQDSVCIHGAGWPA